MSARPYVQQVNLRQGFGGGEVFTATPGSRHVIASLPFGETVMHGTTGLRYRDPREDGGGDFERTLKLLVERGFRVDADRTKPHLAQFSEEAFVERVRVLIERAWNARSGTATGQS